MAGRYPPMAGGSGEPVTAPPAVEVPPEPEPTTAPPAATAPWTQDLTSAFGDVDETIRGRFDTFLRTSVQPHVTRIEQEHAPARELVESLQGEDSLAAYLALADELYGTEVAEFLTEKVMEKWAPQQPAEPTAEPQQPTIPDELKPMYEDWQAQQNQTLYDEEEAKAIQTEPSIQGRERLFAKYMAAAQGDTDLAVQLWQEEMTPIVAPAAPRTPAPAAVADRGTGGGTPPTKNEYDSLDDAIEAFVREQHAAPPTVGSV